MVRRRWIEVFKEHMKKPAFAVPFVGIASGFLLFTFRDYGVAEIMVVTVLAFLASDFLMWLFIKGGHGIFQIPLFGTRTQPKGYGFIAFFLAIIATALLVNAFTDMFVKGLSNLFPELTADIAVGLTLSALVYLAVHVRFYARSK